MRGMVKTIFIIIPSLFSGNPVDLVLLSGLIPRWEGSGSDKMALTL